MNQSIKSKTYKGVFWSFSNFFVTGGIQFLLGIILARLLLPEDYGLIGMITIFIAIGNSIIDSGFTQGLIRKKNVTQEEYSTVFFFNLFISITIYLIIFFSAQLISNFYSEPRLIPVIRVVSLVVIINSLSLIQRTILIKKIDFKSQTMITLFSSTVSGIVAITLAYFGFGIWSLVANILLLNFFQSSILWIYNRWVPSLTFSVQSFKSLFRFGSKLLASSLIDTIYQNIYSPIIGKSFSATELGYYTNALKYKDVISNMVSSSIQRVTYPILSDIRENSEVLKEANRKVLKFTMFVHFPLMMGLIVVAEPLFLILFGEKWLNSIPYFQLLCIVGMLYPLHAINVNILKVKGRSDLFLRLELFKKTFLTLFIILFFKWGIYGLIIAQISNSILSFILNCHYTGKFINYPMKEQLKDLFPFFTISILMAIGVFLSSLLLPDNVFLKLGCGVFIGVILYFTICKIAKIEELDNLLEITFSYLKEIRDKIKKTS